MIAKIRAGQASLDDILKNLSETTNKSTSIFTQFAHMFDKNTNGLIKAATSESEQTVNLMCVSKLIEKSWKKPFKVPKFYVKLSKRPSNKPIIAVKSLNLLHWYMIRGPKAVFTSNVNLVLEKIQRGWKFPQKNSNEVFRDLIYMYVSLLVRKSQLHQENRSFGNWKNHEFIDTNSVVCLLEYWKTVASLVELALDAWPELKEVYATSAP